MISAFRMILAVPLTAISLTTADVSSLTLSSTDVSAGRSVTGSVTITGRSSGTTQVILASSNSSVARVPASLSVGRTGRGSFSVRAAAGAGGCTEISARVGEGPRKSVLLFVHPPSTSGMGITFNPSSAVGGSSLTGRVAVISPGTNLTVQLTSSHPSVTVPASVQLGPEEAGNYAGTFPINTSVVAPSTCSVITATHGGSQVRKLLKVFTISG
jgi:hypothetical protein